MSRIKRILRNTSFLAIPGLIGVSVFGVNMAWLLSFVALMAGLTAFAAFMAIVVFGQIKQQFFKKPDEAENV